MVTITPCFFSQSMAFLVLRQLILLLERFMMRRELILLRLVSKVLMASSLSWLKDKFMLVTLGISQIMRLSPSLVSLFLTNFRPFTRFTGLKQANTSYISPSFSPQPVRSSVSRFYFSQNQSMRALTLLRSGEAQSRAQGVGLFQELPILLPLSLDLLFLRGAGDRVYLLSSICSLVDVKCVAPNYILCSFMLYSLKILGESTSCCTNGSPSSDSLSSRTTLMKLKTELAIPGVSTTLICEMSAYIVDMLVLTLVQRRERRVSPSLVISSGPPQQSATFSSIRGVRSAFWKSYVHLASHCLYLR